MTTFIVVVGDNIRGPYSRDIRITRLRRALEHYKTLDPTTTKIVLSGGKVQNDENDPSEARQMFRYLLHWKVVFPSKNIIIEQLATNTVQNVEFSWSLVESFCPFPRKVVWVTSRFHQIRLRETIKQQLQSHSTIHKVIAARDDFIDDAEYQKRIDYEIKRLEMMKSEEK